jgi:hypothetical protein
MFTQLNVQKGPDKPFFSLSRSYKHHAPPYSFAMCFNTFVFLLSTRFVVEKKSLVNERKYAVYIKTQLNRFVYLSSIPIPQHISFYLESSRGRGSLSSISALGDRSSLGSLSRLLNLRALVLNDIAILLLLPPSGTGPLGLVPRTGIAVLTAGLALTLAAELLREVLSRNLLEKLTLVAGAEDVNLGDGDRVEPALDDAPNGGEAPRSVDHVQLAQTLGVVVLGDDRGLLDVGVDLGDLADGNTLEIHDSAACLEEVASLAGASRKTGIGDALVLDSQVGKHALSGGDLVHGVQVDTAKSLDVDGSTILYT